jgi:RNA-directed DNA polymerase
MNLQEAIDAPAWHIEHFPASFWPRAARPGVVVVENRLPAATIKELERRGHRFCRYADDCNVYVCSRRAGERVMASVSRYLTTRLRLKVNESKSTVARPEERKFLGFSITNDGRQRQIAPKAVQRFKLRVRELTRRTSGISLVKLDEPLARYLIGWRGYFGFCQTPKVLSTLDAWIRRRLRMYLWRRWLNGHNRFKELRRRGVPKFNAAVAAGSPTESGVCQAIRRFNKYCAMAISTRSASRD